MREFKSWPSEWAKSVSNGEFIAMSLFLDVIILQIYQFQIPPVGCLTRSFKEALKDCGKTIKELNYLLQAYVIVRLRSRT